MKKYYAVVGVNGYGVYTNSKKRQKAMEYLIRGWFKGFESFDDAVEWAEECYYFYGINNSDSYWIEKIEKTNWIYYRHKREKTIEYTGEDESNVSFQLDICNICIQSSSITTEVTANNNFVEDERPQGLIKLFQKLE